MDSILGRNLLAGSRMKVSFQSRLEGEEVPESEAKMLKLAPGSERLGYAKQGRTITWKGWTLTGDIKPRLVPEFYLACLGESRLWEEEADRQAESETDNGTLESTAWEQYGDWLDQAAKFNPPEDGAGV